MIVIIGASASGKTEISKILESKYGYKKCVTTTTRPIRINETNHIDYHFITKDEFNAGVLNNEFIEHATYNNNLYGIHKNDAKDNSLVVVEPFGANTLIDKLNDKVFTVYIETDQSIREDRMISRGDNIDDVKLRLKNDHEFMKKENINRIDLFVLNNEHEIDKIAKYIAKEYEKYKKTVQI